MAENRPADPVMGLVREYKELAELLDSDSNYYSLRMGLEASFAKTLVVSSASYFEARLTESLVELYSDATSQAEALVQFVRSLAIDRRYFQWFDWSSNSANSFFGKFGGDFRKFMSDKATNDEDVRASVRAFLELENLRNNLVHANYAAFQLDKSVEDILSLYGKANKFVEDFPIELRTYLNMASKVE